MWLFREDTRGRPLSSHAHLCTHEHAHIHTHTKRNEYTECSHHTLEFVNWVRRIINRGADPPYPGLVRFRELMAHFHDNFAISF